MAIIHWRCAYNYNEVISLGRVPPKPQSIMARVHNKHSMYHYPYGGNYLLTSYAREE